MFFRRIGAALPFFLLARGASAHIVATAQGGFGSGFAHPLTGADHFLAMFAVGVWSAQMGGRRIWTLPVAFPMIMVVGGIAGMSGLAISGTEIGIAISIISLGAAIAASWRPPEVVAVGLIGFFALCHGYAHGVELPLSDDPADYAVGFVLATGMIHVIGIGFGLALHKPLNGTLARLLGGAIGAAGIYFRRLHNIGSGPRHQAVIGPDLHSRQRHARMGRRRRARDRVE
jgi:urease accessory protein